MDTLIYILNVLSNVYHLEKLILADSEIKNKKNKLENIAL